MDDRTSRALAQVECQQVVLDFMARFDAGEAEAAAALWSVDGRWDRADGVVRGRSAVAQLISAREPGRVVRHVVTNLRTELLASDHAVVHSYVMLFKHQAETGDTALPMPLDGVAGLGRYVDELRLVNGQWLIAAKSSVTEFKRS